jgi:class 3 adenylate cyclase
LSLKVGGNKSEGERKQVTVLFADIAGFTSLSEDLDPEEVSDLITPAIEMMAEEILQVTEKIMQGLGSDYWLTRTRRALAKLDQ